MHLLSDTEFHVAAYPALQRLFVNADPYDAPFATHVRVRRILFPYDYEMEAPLLDSIINYATKHGDDGFYYSILGDSMNANKLPIIRTWLVPFMDLPAYQAMTEPLANVIYSPTGLWGIMGSHESHGLLGGHADLAECLTQQNLDFEQQIATFIENWKHYQTDYGANIQWLVPLLQHVYGNEQAQVLIETHQL